MSNSLKILLYLFFLFVIFYFVQDRFNIFDIKFVDEKGSTEEVLEKEEEESTVEIYNQDGKSLIVRVEIADDNQERLQGLSGRRTLGDYEGMLFIMDTTGGSSFWMKDMYIPLDILFIDENGFIIDIHEDMQPCEPGYCPNITSSDVYKYALEVNAGFCKENRVGDGNTVLFNISSDI